MNDTRFFSDVSRGNQMFILLSVPGILIYSLQASDNMWLPVLLALMPGVLSGVVTGGLSVAL